MTLFRKQGGRFVKVAAKTVAVRYLKDRDGDGKTDGSYTATFTRPKAKGSYKVLTRFKGTANYKPGASARCSRCPPASRAVSVPLPTMDRWADSVP